MVAGPFGQVRSGWNNLTEVYWEWRPLNVCGPIFYGISNLSREWRPLFGFDGLQESLNLALAGRLFHK